MPTVLVRVLAAVATLVAVVALMATAWQLGLLTHPVLGWGLVTVVAGTVAWRLVERAFDEQAIRRDRAEHAARFAPDPAPMPQPTDPTSSTSPWATTVPEPPSRG